MSYPPPNDPYPGSPYSQPYNYPAQSQPQQPTPQPRQANQEYYPSQSQSPQPPPGYPSQPYYPPQQPPPGYGMPPQQVVYPYAQVMMVAPSNNGLAVASMVLGIIGLVLSFWGVGVIGSILAVIFGHVALGQIKQSNGTQGGQGMAVAGLVMGYIVVGIIGLCIGATLIFGLGLGFTGLFVHATPTPIPFPSQ